jgi:hypothetical protein
MGLGCIDSQWVYLQVPDRGRSDFEVIGDRMIYLSGGIPKGWNNIYVSYMAGYTVFPSDLKLGIELFASDVYGRQTQGSYGFKQYSIGDLSYSFDTSSENSTTEFIIPGESLSILSRYKKRLV